MSPGAQQLKARQAINGSISQSIDSVDRLIDQSSIFQIAIKTVFERCAQDLVPAPPGAIQCVLFCAVSIPYHSPLIRSFVHWFVCSRYDNHRYEDILAQEEDVASALWAAVGLPPISLYLPPTTAPLGAEDSAAQPVSRRATATDAAAAASSEPGFLAQPLEDGLAAESAQELGEPDLNPGGAPRSGKGKGKGGRRLKGRVGRVTRGMASEGAVVDEEEEEEVGVEGVRPVRRRLMAGDALSRASEDVQRKVLPPECRARIAACDADSVCVSELER